MARTKTLLRIIRELWFDADNIDLRIRKLQACRDAADQSASANGTENRLDVRQIFENLQGYGALASDDLFVVVGRNDLIVVSLREFFGFGFAFVTGRPNENDLGPIRARGRDLNLRSIFRHNDDCFSAEFAGRVCNPLGMIAAGVADHAVTALLHSQGCDLVERATNLECADWLEVFRLEIKRMVFNGLRIFQKRRACGDALDSGLRCFDVGQGNDGSDLQNHRHDQRTPRRVLRDVALQVLADLFFDHAIVGFLFVARDVPAC